MGDGSTRLSWTFHNSQFKHLLCSTICVLFACLRVVIILNKKKESEKNTQQQRNIFKVFTRILLTFSSYFCISFHIETVSKKRHPPRSLAKCPHLYFCLCGVRRISLLKSSNASTLRAHSTSPKLCKKIICRFE